MAEEKSISKIKIGKDYYNLIDANAVHSTEILPIENGGTGATTAAGAVKNIVDEQDIKPQEINATKTIHTSEGAIYTSEGPIYTLDGNIYTLHGDVYTRNGDVYTRNGDVIIKSTDGATDLHKLSQKAEVDHTHAASDITSGVLSVIHGGTGVTGFIPDAVPIGARVGTGIDFVEPADGAFFAPSANDIPRFDTLPIAQGGTGQNGTTISIVVGDIVTAAVGCSIAAARYAQWGKMAHVVIGITCTSAKSSGDTLATIVSGKRPAVTAVLMPTFNSEPSCSLNMDGNIVLRGSRDAGTTLYVIGTYLLP